MFKKSLFFTLFVISCTVLGAQNIPPHWRNPGYASFGKSAPRQEFISYTTRALADKGDPNEAEHYLSLAGQWSVHYGTTREGVVPKFYSPSYMTTSWNQANVPNLAPSSTPSPLDQMIPPQLPGEVPVVQYRAVIEVPYLWLDRDMYIHIEGVSGAYALFVNNQQVGYSNDYRTPAEYNISSAVTDGLNTIGIEVYGYSTGNWMESSLPQWKPGGLGNVFVYSQPKLCIHDFVVRAKLDSARVNGILYINVILSNSYRTTEKITLGYDIYTPEGKLHAYNLLETEIEGESTDTLRFKEYVYPSFKKMWSPESPSLYRMIFYVRRDKRITEYIPFVVGFNETQLKNGELWINDKKAVLNAANYNAASDQATTQKELVELKKAKINTICVDYPQPHWFYELCDRIGFYVVDQANINAGFKPQDRNVGGGVTNDPRFLPQFLDRVATMQGRTKNHTSLIAISMGGESGNGYNLYKSYQLLKQADTIHPVTYRDVQGEWNSDVAYPTVRDAEEVLRQIKASTSSKPTPSRTRR